MTRCILHVGMPKTGSTSIQDSLFFGLRDPQFRYIHLTNRPNAADFLNAIFLDDPSQHWVYQRKGYSACKVERLKYRYQEMLQQALRRAFANQNTPIISSEDCWDYTSDQLQKVRTFMDQLDASFNVIVYIRPFKSWIESDFQQDAKQVLCPFYNKLEFGQAYIKQKINYTERLSIIEQIFGADRVVVRPFKRNQLIDGCVVRDFCKTLDINFEPSKIQRVNVGFSAEAVKLLNSYNLYALNQDSPSFADHHLLTLRLEQLKGQRFRLHSSIIEPLISHIREQEQMILRRYAIDISENLWAADEGLCIRQLDDLTSFSSKTLQWLAQQSQCSPIQDEQGEMAARAVAQQVSQLVHQPAWGVRLRRLKHNLHLKWHGMIHAV